MPRHWYPMRLEFCDGRHACGLGDTCMGAIIAEIMRENGIEIYFYTKLFGAERLVRNVRRWRVFLNIDYTFFYDVPQFSLPLCRLGEMHFIDAFFRFNDLPFHYDGRPADVLFLARDVPHYDVVLNTRSSDFASVRTWPYFDQLKALLTKHNISFFDLDTLPFSFADPEPSLRALDLVAKSRLYVGLDSGLSHYVAKVVNHGLFLQSGHSHFSNWNKYPRCYSTAASVACAPCWQSEMIDVRCPGECQHCIRSLSVSSVFEAITVILDSQHCKSIAL